MNLECLNGIITDNLAIQIDLTQFKSWDFNTGFTAFSLTKWAGAISDNINLIDFGLTEFDNGRTNIMWSGITLTPRNTLFSMYRVGYNVVTNPDSGNTSGYTATTTYDIYPMSAVTSGSSGNYFELGGGYLQGFFKLQDYNFQLLPTRYNNGITIETLLRLSPYSSGIFYMMGLRAEDKYNPYFSGETTVSGAVFSGETLIDVTSISGVNTSENNYLDAFYGIEVNKKAFKTWETRKRTEYVEISPIDNIKGNAIAFFLTEDRKLGYKYIDNNGIIIQNFSPTPVTNQDWTLIAISFLPDNTIDDTDPVLFLCAPQRTGKLTFYINGRAFWIIKGFPEFFFHALKNQREKEIGVPYSISWGGGSFGLRHSWHYDYQKYGLYTGQDTDYIQNNFFVQNDPLPTECESPSTNDYLPGLSLTADSSTFSIVDECDINVSHPLTVMRIEFTGDTGTTATTYFIKYNHPVSVLSNRNYEIDLSFYNGGFFRMTDSHNNIVYSRASIVVYGTVDIDIIDEIQYTTSLTSSAFFNVSNPGLHPFPDRQEYQYIYLNHLSYYGATGVPVTKQSIFFNGLIPENNLITDDIITGTNSWKSLKLTFRTKENTGKQIVYIGLLLESTDTFNDNVPIFINNFTYAGADILSQDPRKDPLLIEQNFADPFIGGIQKLRVYDDGLTPAEILHNALFESRQFPLLDLVVSKGGRIINQYLSNANLTQQTAGSDIRKSIKYRNINNTYKNLYAMIDIMVVIKSKSNPNVVLIKFKKVAEPGWLALIFVDDFTYDFIVPNTITGAHPNEILYAEIKFQWTDPDDIDDVFDKIFIVNLSTTTLLDNTVKNY